MTNNNRKYTKGFDPDKYDRYKMTVLRERFLPVVLYFGLAMMLFNCVGGFVLMILVGSGVLTLSNDVVKLLAASAFGSAASGFALIIKFFFSKR